MKVHFFIFSPCPIHLRSVQTDGLYFSGSHQWCYCIELVFLVSGYVLVGCERDSTSSWRINCNGFVLDEQEANKHIYANGFIVILTFFKAIDAESK
jgi:hypothetical protein